jgi:hypothetical protein
MPPAEQAALAERIALDPQLAQRVEAHRWLTDRIIAAYGAPPEGIPDERLIAQLGLATDNVRSIASGLSLPASRVWRIFAPASAIAASLAIGLLLGRGPLAPRPLVLAERDGAIVAKGELADALSSQLSGEAGAVRIGLSIRTKHGICRTFQASGHLSGLACKEGKRWAVPILEASRANNADGEYHVASADFSPSIMGIVDRTMVGDPLPLDEERRLRENDWR